MPNLRDIERRINSVKSTKQITRTMEMVATAKIKRATERMIAATPYAETMIETLGYLSKQSDGIDNPLMMTHDELKTSLVIVVSSDRGMAGGFNSSVLRYVDRLIKKKQSEGIEVILAACGKKAVSYFTYRNIIPVIEFRDLSADPTSEEANALATYAISAYTEGSVDEVIIVYNHTKNAAEQILKEKVVLPVVSENFNGLLSLAEGFNNEKATSAHANDASAVAAQAKMDTMVSEARASSESVTDAQYGDMIFEPDQKAVLKKLIPAYVKTVIYHALIDSAAAEQGARRTAMKAATDNAADIVESLSRVYNRVRQGAITTEITEIVGGAAALEE